MALKDIMDEQLVEKAKGGDEEAFSQLIKKHRAKAVYWAQTITNDPYLAEDVVQDSLIRSYMNLRNLENSDRFLPWFRTMVRNQAIDYLRKQKGLENFKEDGNLTLSYNFNSEIEYNELMDSVVKLSKSLNDRDQKIFEAHFLKQIPPSEIASIYNITTSNVYNIISRIKVKLQEQRYQQEMDKYLGRKKEKGNVKNILPSPLLNSPYTSLGHVLYEVLKYCTDKNFTLTQVMGFTGQAFRIQMTDDAGLSSSLIYDWDWVMDNIAKVLGCEYNGIGKPGKFPTPDLIIQALQIIQQSIDRGIPAIVWNLTNYEFGIIYGYDDRKRQFNYCDATNSHLIVPYTKLGRTTDNPELFVATLDHATKWPDIKLALEGIIAHAKGQEPKVQGYVLGLSSYEKWIEAFLADRIDAIGHAYNVALLTEARDHAAAFLEQLKIVLKNYKDKEIMLYLEEAKKSYIAVSKIFEGLYPAFPFGLPGIKMDIKDHAMPLLSKAWKEEEKGMVYLEKIYEKLF